jgi:IclR family transcriptional regulator, acetate operon repressor
MSGVVTTLRVLEVVSELQPVGVSDVARNLELPKSSAQRALKALSDAGWIKKVEGNGLARWVLTPRALIVGSHAGGEVGLTTLARPAMEHLHAQTQETIHLLVHDGDFMVFVERLESPHVLRSSYPLGMRAPITACSSGKAFLSALPSDQASEIVSHGLPATTDSSITDQAQMLDELKETRARGFAMNHGELTPDISAVAAAILDARHSPVAALSISVPSQRMTDDRWSSYGAMVLSAAQQVSAELGHKSVITH